MAEIQLCILYIKYQVGTIIQYCRSKENEKRKIAVQLAKTLRRTDFSE